MSATTWLLITYVIGQPHVGGVPMEHDECLAMMEEFNIIAEKTGRDERRECVKFTWPDKWGPAPKWFDKEPL